MYQILNWRFHTITGFLHWRISGFFSLHWLEFFHQDLHQQLFSLKSSFLFSKSNVSSIYPLCAAFTEKVALRLCFLLQMDTKCFHFHSNSYDTYLALIGRVKWLSFSWLLVTYSKLLNFSVQTKFDRIFELQTNTYVRVELGYVQQEQNFGPYGAATRRPFSNLATLTIFWDSYMSFSIWECILASSAFWALFFSFCDADLGWNKLFVAMPTKFLHKLLFTRGKRSAHVYAR